MSFVKLENLNDFIQPSSSCIKPAEKKSTGVVAKVDDVNLADCLACRGCITSAETVLVQQQNYEELFKAINDSKLSKSISSMANKYSISAQEAAERIACFFVSIGCDKVYDINLARHLALLESYREFKAKKASCDKGHKSPIISSICPGWVCYAEKTNGDLIIPHLSRVRSPQQIMGALVKKHYAEMLGSQVYHVTLMPCFDKKLEASRQDFKSKLDGSSDVDCVLTPLELEEILNDEGVTLLDFERRKLDTLQKTGAEFDSPLTSHFARSSSGGYAESLLLAEASEQLSLDTNGGKQLRENMQYSTLKNGDFIELSLKRGDSKMCDSSGGYGGGGGRSETSKFAIVNGFRNIQTIVQRLKRNALKYDYIEIMACPSGCINGGAQCKLPVDGGDQTSAMEGARKVYNEIEPVEVDLLSEQVNGNIYAGLNLNKEMLYTDFHSVQRMQNLTVSW